jgi:hypothetical protein
MTTVTATDLHDYIIGAWYLQSWESFALDGSDVQYPLGHDARGIIMYTADGFMSAQIMRPNRPPFDVSDLVDADKDELAAAASGYMAYSGPFTVSDDGVIAHHVELSLLPNWIGGTQYRAAEAADGRLVLSPVEPVIISGQPRNARLVWRRP